MGNKDIEYETIVYDKGIPYNGGYIYISKPVMHDKEKKGTNEMESYAFEINSAGTIDKDGKASLGIHLKTRENGQDEIDISRNAEGKDITSLIQTLSDGIAKEYRDKRVAAKRQKAEADKAKRDSLRTRYNELRVQMAEIEKEINSIDTPTKNDDKDVPSLLSDFDGLKKYFDALW